MQVQLPKPRMDDRGLDVGELALLLCKSLCLVISRIWVQLFTYLKILCYLS